MPATFTEALGRVRSGEIPLPFDALAGVLKNTLSYLTGTAASLVGLLVIPILAYYLLAEFDHIVARIGSWVPPRHREYVDEKARTIDRLVSSFLRGQLLIAAVLGSLYALGFSIIGIDLAVSIGLIAGALSIIPYVGSGFALLCGRRLCAPQVRVRRARSLGHRVVRRRAKRRGAGHHAADPRPEHRPSPRRS